MTREFRASVTRHGARGLAVRAGLTFLALAILVLPALDLGWNELRLAERQGTPCPFHANPVADLCPSAIDVGQTSEPGEVVGSPLRPQLYDASIFIPPKL